MGSDDGAINHAPGANARGEEGAKSPIELTALEIEQVTQDAKKQVRSIATEDLRLLRAHLLDVVSKGLSEYAVAAQVRGRVVHEEIERRERSLIAKLIQTPTLRWSLERLARFPDLDAPNPLKEKIKRN